MVFKFNYKSLPNFVAIVSFFSENDKSQICILMFLTCFLLLDIHIKRLNHFIVIQPLVIFILVLLMRCVSACSFWVFAKRKETACNSSDFKSSQHPLCFCKKENNRLCVIPEPLIQFFLPLSSSSNFLTWSFISGVKYSVCSFGPFLFCNCAPFFLRLPMSMNQPSCHPAMLQSFTFCLYSAKLKSECKIFFQSLFIEKRFTLPFSTFS